MNAVLTPPARRPIRELPDELISQIAAGEVVERPASVVRELLDNALDAGATQITVRLLAGGVRLVAVEDDGLGIVREELPMALKRHATSKIASLSDLESVGTMGFRGEALAAINSIADCAILSRSQGQTSAWLLDGRSGELKPVARATGTTVEVKELFFSTPARRKFLKTDATELAHCIEAVRRHALVRPDVGFAIWHEGRLVEQWRACGEADQVSALNQRLGDVLGEDFIAQSVAVEYSSSVAPGSHAPAVRVWGRAGIPDAARSRADQQFCYVNGRFVRDKVLTHAARSAYEDVLHGNRQPIYALYVEIDPTRVDVNVHPTKIEVRFRDSREVHQAVRHAVENALAAPRALTAADALARPHPNPLPQGDGAAMAAPFAWSQPAMNFGPSVGHRVNDLSALWQPAPAASPHPNPLPEGEGAASPVPPELVGGLDRDPRAIAGHLHPGRECAGPDRGGHARRARAHRLRAAEEPARCCADFQPAAAHPGHLCRHASGSGQRRGARRHAAQAGPGGRALLAQDPGRARRTGHAGAGRRGGAGAQCAE